MSIKKILTVLSVLSVSSCAICSEDELSKVVTTPVITSVAVERMQKAQKDEIIDLVLFDYNSALLTKVAKQNLEAQLTWLKASDTAKIKLEGHTDERGSVGYNNALGKKRAVAVKNFLVQEGVDSSKIEVISYGKTRPAVTGKGEAIWLQNRRVIITKN